MSYERVDALASRPETPEQNDADEHDDALASRPETHEQNDADEHDDDDDDGEHGRKSEAATVDARTGATSVAGSLTRSSAAPAAEPPENKENTAASRWTIGWVMPVSIVVLYLAALLSAVGHFLFFRWLDGKQVDQSIPQTYTSTVSVGFVTVFRACLVASLMFSFTQILWYILRSRPMKVSTIDSLFSIRSNPFLMASVDVFLCTPLLWLFAGFCWCIPIAVIFPPGALVVVSKAFEQTSTMSVATFDPRYLGNNATYNGGILPNALFLSDDYLNYEQPNIAVLRIGKQVLLGGDYLPSPSPCGNDCSYSIEFLGPSYKCEDRLYTDIVSSVNRSLPSSIQDLAGGPFNRTLFLGIESEQEIAISDNKTQNGLRFEMQWYDNSPKLIEGDPGIVGTGKVPQNLSCVLYEGTYHLDISYLSGEQTTSIEVFNGPLLNLTDIGNDYEFIPQAPANVTDPLGSVIITNSTLDKDGGSTELDLFMRSNLLAIKDSFIMPLVGYLGSPDFHTLPRDNTLIDQTSLVSALVDNGAAILFNISGPRVEQLLQNVTVSMLTISPATAETAVLQRSFVNYYSFDGRLNLILPYFLMLAISLVFTVTGMFALIRNGVSAADGGFMQILCTTRGSTALDKVAGAGCLGGSENMSRELKTMQIVFGELLSKESTSSRAVQRAGFGPPAEVMPLMKGKRYG